MTVQKTKRFDLALFDDSLNILSMLVLYHCYIHTTNKMINNVFIVFLEYFWWQTEINPTTSTVYIVASKNSCYFHEENCFFGNRETCCYNWVVIVAPWINISKIVLLPKNMNTFIIIFNMEYLVWHYAVLLVRVNTICWRQNNI